MHYHNQPWVHLPKAEYDALRAENDRLKHLHNLDHSLADQREREVERLRAALEGVLAEADRKTAAFDRAHEVLGVPIT